MPAAAYSAAVLADLPRIYWKLQEPSGNAVDSSGHAENATGNNPTITYQVPDLTSMGDFAMRFAQGAWMQRLPLSSDGPSDNFSFEFLLKASGSAGAGDCLLMAHGSANFNGFWLQMTSARKIYVVAQTRFQLAAMANAVPTSDFCQVVVSKDAGTWKYSFNGAVDTANAGTNSFTGSAADTGLAIGAWNGSSYNLDISHFALYTNSALSDARVAAHYAAAIQGEATVGQYVTHRGGRGAGW